MLLAIDMVEGIALQGLMQSISMHRTGHPIIQTRDVICNSQPSSSTDSR